MDAKNTIHTKTTFQIIRAEHLAVLAFCTALAAWQIGNVHWWRAFWAFWIIDIIGYLPGAIAFRKSEDGRINRWYHHTYNIAHTYVVCGAGVAVWAYMIGGFEWAMLAVPIHLSVDRGVFGNILKPVELSFEPRDHTDEEVLRALGRRSASDTGETIPREVLTEVLAHPSGFLALSSRNERFTSDTVPGFVAYRKQGGQLWMFGGVHATRDNAPRLLELFLGFAKRQGLGAAAVQVRPDQVGLFASHGFKVNQMGSTYAVSLEGFTLAGGKKMKLRNKIKQAKKAGLRVVELGRDVPNSPEWRAKVDAISDAWLAGKGKKELDFMIGELGDGANGDRRVFLTLSEDDAPIAFISYVPVWGDERPGYLHDLTRRMADAPNGAMELCNATAIERFQEESVRYLHFGFTPFIVDETPCATASRLAHRAIRWLYEKGEKLYPADSQAAYKLKWGADIVEREYLAVRHVTPMAALQLLRLTRSI